MTSVSEQKVVIDKVAPETEDITEPSVVHHDDEPEPLHDEPEHAEPKNAEQLHPVATTEGTPVNDLLFGERNEQAIDELSTEEAEKARKAFDERAKETNNRDNELATTEGTPIDVLSFGARNAAAIERLSTEEGKNAVGTESADASTQAVKGLSGTDGTPVQLVI